MQPIRVAFAGLAHSHPTSDATNLTALRQGGNPIEFVGVYDAEPAQLSAFSERFGCPAAPSLAALAERAPDLVIVTGRPHETAPFVRELLSGTQAKLFVNKVVAGTSAQLDAWEDAISQAPHRVGTASVLRFAPAIRALASRVAGADIWGVRVLAQHDIDMFLAPDRAWQDDPERGGGTLVTAGLHAWEMIGTVLPGAVLDGEVGGWIHRSADSASSSEEAAQLTASLTLRSGARIPLAVTVTGTPGPEVYAVDVFTSTGTHSVRLAFPGPSDSLGFTELATALLEQTNSGRATAPWAEARIVVTNTLRAAEALRGIHHTEKSQR